MKKVIAMIALSAVCFGSVAPVFASARTMQQDTLTKTKVKKKRDKVKMKKKTVKKDTTVKA